MRHSCLLPRYGLSSRPCSAASMRLGRGGVDDRQTHHCGCCAHGRGYEQCRSDAVVPGDGWDGQGCDGDAQRDRHLSDSHGQSTTLRWEPADHHTPAGAVRTRRCHTAEQEQDCQQGNGGGEHGGYSGERRQAEPDCENQSFADPIDQHTPGDQGEHDAHGGHGDDESGGGQAQAAVVVQGGNEKCCTVDEHRACGLREHAERKHEPSPDFADVGHLRGGVHQFSVSVYGRTFLQYGTTDRPYTGPNRAERTVAECTPRMSIDFRHASRSNCKS